MTAAKVRFRGFTYEATDPGVDMGSYEVSRHGRDLGNVSRLDSSEAGPAGWTCSAGFYPTRHAAAQALQAQASVRLLNRD